MIWKSEWMVFARRNVFQVLMLRFTLTVWMALVRQNSESHKAGIAAAAAAAAAVQSTEWAAQHSRHRLYIGAPYRVSYVAVSFWDGFQST